MRVVKIPRPAAADLATVIRDREAAWLSRFDPATLTWRRVGDLEWSDGVVIDGVLVATRRSVAIEMARRAGARLPTTHEADAMHAAAMHVEPVVARPIPYMAYTEAIEAHSREVLSLIPSHALADNWGKLWVADGTNYGWWEKGAPHKSRAGAPMWQPLAPGNHSDAHVDYSQTLRFVRDVQEKEDIYEDLGDDDPIEVVATASWRAAPNTLATSYVPARDQDKRPTWARCRGVCIHTAELSESMDAAERLQEWARRGANVSWHYAIDKDSIAQSVLESDRAWAAGPGNDEWIHIELAGYSRQSPAEWRDAYSTRVLELLARLLADIAHHYRVPLRRPSVEEIIAGTYGVVGHGDISVASQLARRRQVRELPWYRDGRWRTTTHMDPWKNFPWDALFARAEIALAERDTKGHRLSGDDMEKRRC